MTKQSGRPGAGGLHRRTFLMAAGATALHGGGPAAAQPSGQAAADLARVATISGSRIGARIQVGHLNIDRTPLSSNDPDSYELWNEPDGAWLQYDWDQPVATDRVDLYLAGGGWERSSGYRLSYWDGQDFRPVEVISGLETARDRYNITRFNPVTTTRLRLTFGGAANAGVGVLRWKVWSSGPVPRVPPAVAEVPDRTVIVGGATYLGAQVARLEPSQRDAVRWHKVSGPGEVRFADAGAAVTTATVSAPGSYELALLALGAGGATRKTVRLKAEPPPPPQRLDVVYTTPYALSSPFWRARAKALIVNWIPHCIDMCERSDLPDGKGGLDNFVEAAKALRGQPHGPHLGHSFSNAWVHQTVEAMCIALMVDPDGDPDMIAAQARMRAALDRWIPTILGAQHPDGYLQTAYTLADRKAWPHPWSASNRADHEGYVAGYFIESAINHHMLTGGRDLRLYNAARKLADCWVANLGPGKRAWFDGHQEMEQALVRFGRFVNDVEGQGQGTAYIDLARFLIESRRGGNSYDQSHLPAIEQYEAVGHAVRAVYFYSGMADIAAETGDRDYQSAVASLWDNIVNRKYYVTGGIGSGDTSEGFGDDYALRHDAYCESCSSCGLIFFQYKLNLAYHDAKFADLFEETLYNALLGSVDLDARNYTYENPLAGGQRYGWHNCPCCVGNIPRTLLMAPTWAYAKGKDALHVNLFIGSRIQVGKLAGTEVEMVQETDYPWDGRVVLTVNPQSPATFELKIRAPDRNTSALYTAHPPVSGLQRLRVNGKPVKAPIVNGYAVVRRTWARGDKVEFELPLPVQRVTADQKVAAARGQVALRRGPLVYNVETADQPGIDASIGAAPLAARWRPDLLGGVQVIEGRWSDGSALVAIPNHLRLNRGDPSPPFPTHRPDRVRSQVWIKA